MIRVQSMDMLQGYQQLPRRAEGDKSLLLLEINLKKNPSEPPGAFPNRGTQTVAINSFIQRFSMFSESRDGARVAPSQTRPARRPPSLPASLPPCFFPVFFQPFLHPSLSSPSLSSPCSPHKSRSPWELQRSAPKGGDSGSPCHPRSPRGTVHPWGSEDKLLSPALHRSPEWGKMDYKAQKNPLRDALGPSCRDERNKWN